MPKDPDILVDLTTARTAFEAEMIAESLRAQGIPAEAFTTAGSTLQWDIAATQPMRVQVRRRDLERARDALRAIRAESVDIDWSEVETGDPSVETADERRRRCHQCGYDVTALSATNRCPECGAGPDDRVPLARTSRTRRIAHPMAIYTACLVILEPLFFGVTWLLVVWQSPWWWTLYETITGHALVWMLAGAVTWILLQARERQPPDSPREQAPK